MQEGTWTLRPCPRPEVVALVQELDISETTASVLVRRGYGDPAAARTFLAGERPAYDPLLLGDMEAACDAIRRTVAAGKRICVHGDYDADGICATALAVLVLRKLGAEVEWHLPSRFEEGYGVSRRRSRGWRARVRVSSSPSIAGSPPSTRSPRRRRSGSRSSSRTTTGRASGSRTARSSQPARRTTRFLSCAAPESCSGSERHCSVRRR